MGPHTFEPSNPRTLEPTSALRGSGGQALDLLPSGPMITLVRRSAAVLFALLLLPATQASAQLVAAKDGPIVYGHHHLNVTDADASRKFFIEALGGVPAKLGTIEMIKFPNAMVMLAARKPSGGHRVEAEA